MDIRLSVGNYAKDPYCLKGLELRVYCVEELCYVLKENAFLLDLDLMTDELVNWVRTECGLEELAEFLHRQIHTKGSLSAFVRCILEYTGLYEKDVIFAVEQTLKKGAGYSALQKRKLRIDQLTAQKKYVAAVREYDALLPSFEDGKGGSVLLSQVLHNKAVALAGLMLYAEAAEVFRKAYEADGNEESLACAFAAKRMELTDREYVDYLAQCPEGYEVSLRLEKQIEQINQSWEQEADFLRLQNRGQLLKEEEETYLEESAAILQALKDSYRRMVSVNN